MIQPDDLKTDAPLVWSTGTGATVWAMFCAAAGGDLAAVRALVAQDPPLVRCQYAYRTPLYFAVRENQLAVAAFLLEHGTDPLGLGVHDSLLDMARDRGYVEMQQLLEARLARALNASPKGLVIAGVIRERNLQRVQAMLDASPELLDIGDERSNQPIHWAVMTRQMDIIDELLARGANIDAKRADGARPIHLTNGDYHYRGWRDVPEDTTATPAEVLAHLIARGAYYDIWTAAHRGDLARVTELLNQDPSLANRTSDYNSYYPGCGAPLRNAAAQGHLAIVQLLLERGADPNLREEGIAPHGHALYSAAANGHHEIAQLLLEHGANPSAAVESSADCLSRAISNGDRKMVDLLASYGAARSVEIMAYYGDVHTAAAVFAANPALADDPGALANAAAEGQAAFVRLMLRYRPGLARRVGVAAKSPELTGFLFQHGMDPNHADWLGVTRLHEFARKGDIANATLFLDRGADPNVRDEDLCSTPLGWAAKFGQLEMAKLLLSRGAKAHPPETPAWATPLAWATRRGHARIVELVDPLAAFVEAACVPLDGGHASGTLERAAAILAAHPELAGAGIHTAAILGDDDAVRRFLALGAGNATAPGGPRGWDALTYLCFSRYLRLDSARSEGFVLAAEALLDAGASANTGFDGPGHQPTPEFESVLYGAAGVAHHPELTRLLLARGADPNDGEVAYHAPEWFDDRAMWIIVESGRLTPANLTVMLHRKLDWHHYDGVRWLLERGAEGSLHHALERNNGLRFFELLLDHGADPARLNPDGQSAFTLAARRGRGDVLELLERRGFPETLDGANAFLAACARADEPRARGLLAGEPGMVARILADHGDVLYDFAGAGNTGGVRLLLELGFPIAARTSRRGHAGGTALHVAVWRERRATVRLLIERGAPLETVDRRGETPLSLAVRALTDHGEWTPHESAGIVATLLKAGARPETVQRCPSGSAEADELLRQYGRAV